MISDRITEDYDWRDGINQFRLRINQDLEEIFKQLEEIKQTIKEKTP
jgi:hypothetical protein|tara:strand:+ start:385 stop:525 length:141 start_codon:yes stop_codon:yes gene_type:complete